MRGGPVRGAWPSCCGRATAWAPGRAPEPPDCAARRSGHRRRGRRGARAGGGRPAQRGRRGRGAGGRRRRRPRPGGARARRGRGRPSLGPASRRGVGPRRAGLGGRARWPGTPRMPPGPHRPVCSRPPPRGCARRSRGGSRRRSSGRACCWCCRSGRASCPGFVATTVAPVVLHLLGGAGALSAPRAPGPRGRRDGGRVVHRRCAAGAVVHRLRGGARAGGARRRRVVGAREPRPVSAGEVTMTVRSAGRVRGAGGGCARWGRRG